MNSVVHVRNLSKRYRISHGSVRRRYVTLRETIVDLAKAPLQRRRNPSLSGEIQDFWALRDINFEVEQGEVVGVVGRNGAGKSTLLKILTRITTPTEGTAQLRGRVGSLLEVGTGFHPELTGRENIYLNGSILGMSRREIHQQFENVVEFAGVEQFLDTPVKRYSSGMNVRLAFSVAAHLNPEILLIDEVLAVGDAEFQRRCLGKMGDVARSGRTVLFVSHNMSALKNLCPRSIMIDKGRLVLDGPTDQVIPQYLRSFGSAMASRDLSDDCEQRAGTGEARVQSVKVLGSSGEPAASIPMGEGMTVRVEIRSKVAIPVAAVQVSIMGDQGDRYCRINSFDTKNWTFSLKEEDRVFVDCRIPAMNLCANTYRLHLQVLNPRVGAIDTVPFAVSFEVVPADVFNTGRVPYGENVMYYPADWDVTRDEPALPATPD